MFDWIKSYVAEWIERYRAAKHAKRGKLRVETRNAEKLANHIAYEFGLKVGIPAFGPHDGMWVAFGKGWSFENTALFIDYRRVAPYTHVRAFTGSLPEGASVGLEFYANP